MEENYRSKEYTDIDNGFYALSGSVLGKSIMYMLWDHKVATAMMSRDTER